MKDYLIPWINIVKFHREIATRSEESFFSFRVNDQGSEHFSYINSHAITKMQIASKIQLKDFSNKTLFSSMDVDQKNSEFYVGGIFWYTNKKIDGEWVKIAHPLFYKPYNVKKDISDEKLQLQPEQAKWDISPMFYKLLDKKGVILDGNLEEIALKLVEEINRDSRSTNFVLDFTNMFVKKYPELKKEFIDNAPRDTSKQWLIFVAPKDFSAIQRNLILDYSKLINKLQCNRDVLGGFELFEKHEGVKKCNDKIVPIIPLNRAQIKVVEKVISGNDITVVSGPPGCGKSQVIISILLNAWEKGQSVLFASSNNQAVDVVRERMRQFEKNIPLVVRCGAKKTSELMLTLDKMITVIDNYDNENIVKKKNQIGKFEKDLKNVTNLLNSNLPQRVDELSRAALRAYGKAGEYKQNWRNILLSYDKRLQENHITLSIYDFEESVYMPFENWMNEHEKMIRSIQCNVEDKRNLQSKIDDLKKQVSCKLEADYENSTGDRVIRMDKVNEIDLWYTQYKNFLINFTETDLQEVEWLSDYNEWNTAEETKKWIDDADKAIYSIKYINDRYCDDIKEINIKQQNLRRTQEILANNGIKSINKKQEETLKKWVVLNNQFFMMPQRKLDILPFSKRKKPDKKLVDYEAEIIDLFDVVAMDEFILDAMNRRRYIASHIDELLDEFYARQEVLAIKGKMDTIQREQKACNKLLSVVGVPNIQSIFEENVCDRVVSEINRKIQVAKNAKYALEKQKRRNVLIKQEKNLRYKGAQLLYPLMDGVKEISKIKDFLELINSYAYKELSLEMLQSARQIIYNHVVESYLLRLKDACKIWDDIDQVYSEIQKIKEEAKYQFEWMQNCPSILQSIFSKKSYQSMFKFAKFLKKEIEDIYNDWNEKGQKTINELKQKEKQERDWARNSMHKALELCPEKFLSESKERIVEYIKEENWDISYIRNIFSKINSDGLSIRQSRIKMALEDAILAQALWKRMEELHNDSQTKAALTRLYMEYKRTNEVITAEAEDDFVMSLKALPLWITTGQSPQAIPMKPGMFDLLIIDEATQCTITSVLPLIYRCKRIVVIGDMYQLPAIDNISNSAEKYIADRFSVDNYLYLLGHCGCNIYKSVLNLIPIKQGNVISLTDHYRSHPLIIGFANYYVYKNRLILKKTMKEIRQNKTSGIFGINITGYAYRDKKTDSWCNRKEADEVVRLIQSFNDIEEYGNFSIGVITPFRGQVNLIYERLQQIGNVTNVLVATVHKYQGDEKDIIIFSPVVSQGITPGAAKWVENPLNLVNVAVTRAKEALYIVSDFEVCRRQPGILGDLVRYTEKIELLRKTSQYELQLFGLMILQGWQIEIHPRVKDIEVDFIVVYMEKKVVIEVDGRQHELQQVMDENRDAMLGGCGYDVVRIPTREIVDTPFEVIERIRTALKNNVV